MSLNVTKAKCVKMNTAVVRSLGMGGSPEVNIAQVSARWSFPVLVPVSGVVQPLPSLYRQACTLFMNTTFVFLSSVFGFYFEGFTLCTFVDLNTCLFLKEENGDFV